MPPMRQRLLRCTIMSTAYLFLAIISVSAASISSVGDIVNNSIFDGGSEYTLNPGNYTITPGSNIVFTPNTLVLNNSATVLIADNSGQSGTMLNLSQLVVGPGTVNATAGQSSSPHAFSTAGATINAGAVVNALGGAVGSASGIWTRSDGVVQNGGSVTATGGSGSLSAGMYLVGGSYSMNGGTLAATGGTGSNSAGVRVASGGFNVLGGDVTAQGGLGGRQQSSGIYVTGTSGVRVDGGTLTASGGNASQNYGLYTQYRVQVDSGTVTAQGGTGSNTAGIRLVLEDFYQNGGTVNATAGTGFVAAGIYGTSNTYHMNGGTLNTFGGDNGSVHGLMLPTLSIQQGDVTATGSGTSLSRGISATTISQAGGTLAAIGAATSGAASSVAVYAGSYTVSNSVVSASGGGGTRTRGLYVANTFNLTDSSLTATGGSGDQSYGAHVIGPVTLNGGSITGTGGDGDEAHGLLFSQSATLDGSLTTKGGGGTQAYGAFINGVLSHSNSPITATGGAGSAAYGLYANDVATLDGSSLAATGGIGGQAVGAYFNSSLEQNDAAITASGGGSGAHGLFVGASATLSNSGLTATGGGDQAYGAYINGTLRQDNAPVVAKGGSGAEAYGVYVNDSATLDNSLLNATGGSGNQAYGAYFASLNHTGAAVTAIGGDGSESHGLHVAGAATLNNSPLVTTGGGGNQAYGAYFASLRLTGASITANGGDGSGAYGLYVTAPVTLNNSPLTVTGGSGDQAYGAYFASLNQTGAAVTANGGDGLEAHGLHVNDTATLNNSPLNVTGGSGNQAYGAYFASLNQTGAAVTANGGDGLGAYGLYVNDSATLSNSPLNATGGSGTQAYGAYFASFNQIGATITANGGDGTEAYGLYVNRSATLNNSSLNTTGGSGSQAFGSSFASLTLTDTPVTATGGTGVGAHGLDVLNIEQNAGLIVAQGSAAQNNAYGINIRANGSASIGGELKLERPTEAASFYLSDNARLTLQSNSLLVPVVDIARIDRFPDIASGLITGGGSVTIASGATVTPYFIDTRGMLKHRTVTSIPFIELTGSGSIDGEFDHVHSGYFLEYTIAKISDQAYGINVVRNHEIIEEVPFLECNNSRGLVSMMDGVLNQEPTNRLANNVWTALDNSQSEADWRRRAAHIGKTMAPLSYTKLTQSLVRVADLTRYDFSRQLDNLTDSSRAFAQSEGALANMSAKSSLPWQVWASPLYQQSSRFKPVCYEFDDVKEKFYGSALGFGRDLGNIALGAAYHYVHGRYDSDYTDIKTDNHGFTVGAQIHDLLPADGWINPWLSVILGHTWSDIDLKSLSYDYLAKSAKPDARAFTAEAELGNSFQVLTNLSLSPKIGVEYAHVSQDGYTDSTSSAYSISVHKGSYQSLKPKIGFDIDLQATDRLSLNANAHYRYKTMDKRSSFYTEAVNLPDIRFMAEGEKLHRASGRFGLGAMYRINDRAAVQLNYNLSVSENYTAHQVNAGVRFAF